MKPTTIEVEELKQLIAMNLDVTEFLDIIGISSFELVELLEEQIIEYFDDLLDAVE